MKMSGGLNKERQQAILEKVALFEALGKHVGENVSCDCGDGIKVRGELKKVNEHYEVRGEKAVAYIRPETVDKVDVRLIE